MRIFRIICLSLLLTAAPALMAEPDGKGPKRPDKTEWLKKMKRFKHEFMARELDLSDKQAKEFFELYDAKEHERFEAEKAVRRSDKNLSKSGDNASAADYDKAIELQYELDTKLANIEKKYLPQFRQILTRRQLFKLRHAEREFQRTLMDKRKDCPPPKR